MSDPTLDAVLQPNADARMRAIRDDLYFRARREQSRSRYAPTAKEKAEAKRLRRNQKRKDQSS